MIRAWQSQSSEQVADCRIFKVRKDVTISPRTGQAHEMFTLEHPDWLNMVPITPDGDVVMVEQWRHGTRSVHLETPGGLIDPGESVAQCARRELLEETGYAAEEIIPLGQVHPNPALQGNWQHYVLATNCRPIASVSLDDAEDIRVRLVPEREIADLIRSGGITHSLVIGAFYWLDLYRRHG